MMDFKRSVLIRDYEEMLKVCYVWFFFHKFLPHISSINSLPSFHPSFFLSFLPSLIPSFISFFLPSSCLPCLLHSFLPLFFLPSLPPFFLFNLFLSWLFIHLVLLFPFSFCKKCTFDAFQKRAKNKKSRSLDDTQSVCSMIWKLRNLQPAQILLRPWHF